ncbi:DNA replication complex GINS protein PSF1 [Smittium mucronatum]|uniref:DNA replication complex GINS protein PSF1 n=1 Tax=Smittium mucronatum TaxID=133383 RepID=A0A1R0GP83_9FUNG|nr:DNA replication complex GINS protein PSF1 [Smittium mucronatum]
MLGDEAYQLALEAKRIESDNLPPYNNKQVALVVRQTRQLWDNVEKLAKVLEQDQQKISQNSLDQYSVSDSSISYQQSISNMALSSSQDQISNTSNSQIMNKFNIDSQSTDQTTFNLNEKYSQQNTKPLMSQLILQHLTVYRNKRVLMVYHFRRCEALKRIAWALNLNPHLLSSINNINASESSKSLNIRGRASRKKTESTADSISPYEKQFIIDYTNNVKKYRNSVELSLSLDTDLDFGSKLTKPPRDLFIEVRVIKECGEIQTEFGVVNLEKDSQHFLRRTDVENLINLGYLQHIA